MLDTQLPSISSSDPDNDPGTPSPRAIPTGVWGLGSVSFLINISSVMIFGLSAVYLKAILGVATGWIGLLEGIVEGSAYITKVLSGIMSDYLRRRKYLMVIGYGLVLMSRPILASSATFGAVFMARFLDRFGNGIQASPRDALVSDIAPAETVGACFGLRQSLATAGSFLGGVIGIIAMLWTQNNFHQVFWLATIPAALAVFILVVMVKEPLINQYPKDHKTRHPINWSDLQRLGRAYWVLMIIVATFMLARLGEAFLVLHAHQNFSLPESYAPLILILYNATYSLSSYPVGRFSDHFSRYTLLALSIIILIITDLLLAFAPSLWVVLGAVALWGIQMGISQSMFLSLVAETVPEDLRGTGYGFFYLISAISLVISGVAAGSIAQVYGESMAFLSSFGIAAFSLIVLLVLRPRKGEQM